MKNKEIELFDESNYNDNGKICFLQHYTLNNSSINIDYCKGYYFKISALYTLKLSRRKGDASKLINHVKEIAIANKFDKIDVYLPDKSSSLIEYEITLLFLVKNGFKFYEKSKVKMFCELRHQYKTVEDSNSHYDNTNGSLYLFAEQHKLNAYEFDLIKRVVRCRKKGEFLSDLEKIKTVIDLYLKEQGYLYEGQVEKLNK
jgi:GNAT superfamily N-acetyltransferase